MMTRALLLLLALGALAIADDVTEAKVRYKRATAAYALGDFVGAAREYEAAFKLEPDPALLYDAAQAHRMAGNSVRALELYQSYLRLPGADSNRDDVERHIANLKAAIEKQRKAESAPPYSPAPMAPSLDAMPTPLTPVPHPSPRPWYKRGAVWGTVAGAVVVTVTVGVGAGVGARASDPTASLGAVKF